MENKTTHRFLYLILAGDRKEYYNWPKSEQSHTILFTLSILPHPPTDGNNMDTSGTPTSPVPASGNGVITQPKKVRGIGFGDIFSEGSLKLKVRLPSPDTEEKKERVSV